MIVISLIVWPPLELINLFLGPFSTGLTAGVGGCGAATGVAGAMPGIPPPEGTLKISSSGIGIGLLVWSGIARIGLLAGPEFRDAEPDQQFLPEISVLVVWKFGKDGSEEREEKIEDEREGEEKEEGKKVQGWRVKDLLIDGDNVGTGRARDRGMVEL